MAASDSDDGLQPNVVSRRDHEAVIARLRGRVAWSLAVALASSLFGVGATAASLARTRGGGQLRCSSLLVKDKDGVIATVERDPATGDALLWVRGKTPDTFAVMAARSDGRAQIVVGAAGGQRQAMLVVGDGRQPGDGPAVLTWDRATDLECRVGVDDDGQPRLTTGVSREGLVAGGCIMGASPGQPVGIASRWQRPWLSGSTRSPGGPR
jgi:hypothetical protein